MSFELRRGLPQLDRSTTRRSIAREVRSLSCRKTAARGRSPPEDTDGSLFPRRAAVKTADAGGAGGRNSAWLHLSFSSCRRPPRPPPAGAPGSPSGAAAATAAPGSPSAAAAAGAPSPDDDDDDGEALLICEKPVQRARAGQAPALALPLAGGGEPRWWHGRGSPPGAAPGTVMTLFGRSSSRQLQPERSQRAGPAA